MSPYAFEEYVNEGTKRGVRDFLVLAHAGHDANSYALSYYFVWKPLRPASQGLVVDRDDERVGVNSCRGILRGKNSSVDADIGWEAAGRDVIVYPCSGVGPQDSPYGILVDVVTKILGSICQGPCAEGSLPGMCPAIDADGGGGPSRAADL